MNISASAPSVDIGSTLKITDSFAMATFKDALGSQEQGLAKMLESAEQSLAVANPELGANVNALA